MYQTITPFLSVIIPAHNEEKTICKTVDSIMLQDYSCFEIIVVDDGSDDNTGKYLTDYFGLYQMKQTQNQCPLKHKPIVKIWNGICKSSCVYLIQKENGGKGDALNAGIGFCHGDCFACIDADCTFPTDTLSLLSNALCKNKCIAAIGGKIIPLTGLLDFIKRKGFHLKEALQGYQELEYGIAFSIVRPFFDKLGTTMLISGALGLFNKDVVIQLGGYALDTVGEDMELVMRIRKFAAENDETIRIEYAKTAICFTELPWTEKDLRKQRIRWTVGLTDVLWKYREMAICTKYSFQERLTFWYYILFEKYAPHIEFVSLIMCILTGGIMKFYKTAVMLIVISAFFQFLLSIAGSFQPITESIKASENKFRAMLKILLLMGTFVTIYHLWHSFFRLIAVPVFHWNKHKTKNYGPSWISPQRM